MNFQGELSWVPPDFAYKMHINLHMSLFFCNFAAKLEWNALIIEKLLNSK